LDSPVTSPPLASTAPEDSSLGAKRPIVCVQGLGFVGAAMAVAVASARNAAGAPIYNVIGVDVPTPTGVSRSDALNRGIFPFATMDANISEKTRQAHAAANLSACTDAAVFGSAAVIIVDVALDVLWTMERPTLDLESFRSAIRSVGACMRPDALVIIETTVPPGTTARVVAPTLRHELTRRRLPTQEFLLAHSYERVMPGDAYFDSIVNMWRVYAGLDARSSDACELFLNSVINVADYPLTRLSDTTASELAKALENAFRAVTIAMMQEWGSFAETVGVDLFEVVDAVRMRSTHINMRIPGFGVGGYCLTKDPLLGELAAREVFKFEHPFPFASMAVATNREMPQHALNRLRSLLGGSLHAKHLLLLGLCYRQDIGDTRHSPSEVFFKAALEQGAHVRVHDPLVDYWPEQAIAVPREMPPAAQFDAVVLAVPHRDYKRFDYRDWLNGHRLLFLDAFDVLSAEQRNELRSAGCCVESIGRGQGL
jgi:nucleotide sugar dehydrogenase